ncbi:hypothetical protein PTRG_04835 [Pyrenophora tritici-repentis Pt-1C-BFP]|uniref:Uncharacterized protein n=2 Tax=Pyrenophora tritici-repentis TaxID=45151 RepID=B2W5D5_PYRTR|nr:uncharacterized protein PTRG_04835 [Pyrenophora tritici-repentis Pt-1C-BFP]EDU47742.1 hypothetical protein PTRG_04835 [Pyrenophora tritici-repentis Pt-1C-BFP]
MQLSPLLFALFASAAVAQEKWGFRAGDGLCTASQDRRCASMNAKCGRYGDAKGRYTTQACELKDATCPCFRQIYNGAPLGVKLSPNKYGYTCGCLNAF